MDSCWVSLMSHLGDFALAIVSLEKRTEELLLDVSAKVFPLQGDIETEAEEGTRLSRRGFLDSSNGTNFQRTSSSAGCPGLDDCHGLLHSISLSELKMADMLGYGGSGVVHRAQYRGRPVAVKLQTFSDADSEDEQTLDKARCLSEIKLGSRLRHQNIVAFVGAAVNNCRPVEVSDRSKRQVGAGGCGATQQWALVTELMEGGNLRTFLDRRGSRKLPASQVLHMALDISRGMEYLHRSGVIHRDLKSSNLLLDSEGRVKVADLGSAAQDSSELSSTSICDGTVRWMAPEMMEGKAYTRKVDVYAFGIILWELCTGALPFEGTSIIQIANAVTLEDKRPPTDNLPPGLVQIMSKCWARAPEDRPTFAEVVRWLEKCKTWDVKGESIEMKRH